MSVNQSFDRSIRPLTPADLEALVGCSKDLDFSEAWGPSQLTEELKLGNGLGLFVGKRLAAFVLWRVLAEVLEVTWLGTSSEFQRQGLMTALIEHWANANQQFKSIWLEVHEENRRARSLYEGLGFRTIGRRPQYYRDGGAAILYTKDL